MAKRRNRIDTLYMCLIDEYRTSKQSAKLRDLLSGQRADKVIPAEGTQATWRDGTTFRITTRRPWGLLQFTGPHRTGRIAASPLHLEISELLD